MTEAELAILKTELDTDPLALGYAGQPDTQGVADLLNTVGLSVPPETIPDTSVSVSAVMDAVDASELPAVDVNGLQFFLERLRLSGGSVDISAGSAIIGQVADIFTVAAAPNSRTALNALTTREASRAEVLFGIGVTVTHTDVGLARQVV